MIEPEFIIPPIAEMRQALREVVDTYGWGPPLPRCEHRDTIEPTTTKGQPMTDAVIITTPAVHDELDADTAAALGLDPTGRDGDARFPFTIGKLSLEELLLLQALANQDEHYHGELEDADGCALWYDVANAEVEHRLGPVASERYYEWSTVNRLTAEELIENLRVRVRDGRGPLDHVLREISGHGV